MPGATIYRAVRQGKPYAVRVFAAESGEAAERARQACRDAAKLARARHLALPRIIAVGTAGSDSYVASELVQGKTLADTIIDGPLEEQRVLEIGQAVAGALAAVHRLGVVHGQVRPGSIVLRAEGGPCLLDYEVIPLAGELADSSSSDRPDQTEILRRPLDVRSDLYALGAVLFESAAGRLPVGAAGPGDTTAEQQTLRDVNPTISPALAAVLAKLLSPLPDDRYESASALLNDLDLVPMLDGHHPGAVALEVQRDRAPLSVAGRKSELDKLWQLWQEAVRDRGHLVLLHGPSGSGKTHLAHVFLDALVSTGKMTLSGRCGEAVGTPFGALRQALDAWLESFARLLSSERAVAEQRLRIAAGDVAGLLRLFSPGFDRLFADVPRAIETDILHERFHDILAEFLLKLAGCYGGMVLFLDDVQWLDTSSQQVLKRTAERFGSAPLLVITALRSDSRTAARAASQLALEAAAVVRIRLTPLSVEATGQLVASFLGEAEVAPEIVGHIASWTSGNPLAIGEYLEALLEAGVLLPQWDGWVLDESGLAHLRLPRDVAHLMAGRLRGLPRHEADVLRIASLLGRRISLPALQAAAGADTDIGSALLAGLAHGLLRVGSGECEFAHESVREALTAGLPPDAAKDLHQRIAEALDALPQSEREPHVFTIARHYALGHAEQGWRQVYTSHLAAGLAAMESLADAEAYQLLRQASQAATAGGIEPSADLDEALGEVCARSGRWDEALTHLARALERTTDPLRQAGLHARLARVHLANRATTPSWDEIERGFRALGAPIGKNPLTRALYSVWSWIVGLLALNTRVGYGSIHGKRRERLAILSKLYITGAYTAYLLHDHLRLVEMVVRQLYIGHRLGDSIELASAYTSYANILALLGRTEAASCYSARSLDIVQKLGDRFQLARMHMFDAWQLHVGGLPRQAEDAMRRCLQADGSWLDAADFAYAHIDLAWNLSMRGYCREALEIVEIAIARAQPDSGESRNLEIKAAALLATLGQSTAALERADRARPAAADRQNWLSYGYYSYLLFVLLEVGELGEPLEEAISCHRATIRQTPRQTAFHARHFFIAHAYARLEQCMRDPSDANRRRFGQAMTELRQISSHPTIRSHYLVIRASWERIEGRPRPALRQLMAAEEVILEADNLWAQFERLRQLAHTLAMLDNHEAALRQARDAYRLAVSQGWVARARLVRSEFDALRAAPESAFAESRWPRAEAERDPGQLEQHLEALLQVSLAASATLDPLRQAQVALDEILGVLRAERAFLFTVTAYGELELRAGRSAKGKDLPELTGYSRTVVETVRSTGEPVIDTDEDEDSKPPQQTRSIVAAPVMMKGDLLGVVYVDSELADGFSDDDVRILTAIANHIAIALQNASAVAQQTALTRANSDLLEALRLQVSELRESRRQITAAEERLRREIAEMLHSRVQSKLLVAAHQLGQAVELVGQNPDEAMRLLTLSQQQLEDVREREIRDASHLLHPSIIRIGLAPAVRSLIGRFEDMFHVSLEVDPRLAKLDSIVDNHLPEELRLTAYRALEEALANITRHAHATEVRVSLSLSQHSDLLMQVLDNGVGFDSTQLRPGLGLSSIDGRVNQLGGTWRIESHPGQGTTVHVTLPLALGAPSPSL